MSSSFPTHSATFQSCKVKMENTSSFSAENVIHSSHSTQLFMSPISCQQANHINSRTSEEKLTNKKRKKPNEVSIENGELCDKQQNTAKSFKQEVITGKVTIRKKRDRFNGMSEEEVLKRTLPDHVAYNLDIIIVGINPGLTAAYIGHHYAGPGNHFWKCLYLSGLIPEPFTAYDDERLLKYGIGFTNIVERTSRGSSDLTRKEIKEGGEILKEKILKWKPKIAVFNGKGIYEIFCGHKNFHIGKQPDPFPGTQTTCYVMPSSSARCSQLPRAIDKVPFYVALKKLRDYARGDLPHLDDSEVCFPDLELKVKVKEDKTDGDLKNVKQEPSNVLPPYLSNSLPYITTLDHHGTHANNGATCNLMTDLPNTINQRITNPSVYPAVNYFYSTQSKNPPTNDPIDKMDNPQTWSLLHQSPYFSDIKQEIQTTQSNSSHFNNHSNLIYTQSSNETGLLHGSGSFLSSRYDDTSTRSNTSSIYQQPWQSQQPQHQQQPSYDMINLQHSYQPVNQSFNNHSIDNLVNGGEQCLTHMGHVPHTNHSDQHTYNSGVGNASGTAGCNTSTASESAEDVKTYQDISAPYIKQEDCSNEYSYVHCMAHL